MSRRELTRLTEQTLRPYGMENAFSVEESGTYYKVHWDFQGKKNSIKAPRDLDAYRASDNFRRDLKRQVESAGFSEIEQDESKIHVNDQIKALKQRLKDLEDRLDAKSLEIDSCAELALEAASGVEGLRSGLLNILGQPAPKPNPLPIQAEPVPEVIQPKIRVAPQPIERPAPVAAKGFDALEQVRNQKWAEIVARMDVEFEFDDLEGRVLYFLHEYGPCTPHDLKQAGVWKSTDSVTWFLNDMQAKEWVRYLVAEKKYGITNEGIKALADSEPEDVAEIVAPVTLASTDEMLNGQSRAAPVLQIVPKQPRILAPVPQRIMPQNLSVKDEMLVYIYWNGPQTTADMMAAKLRGYGANGDDISTAASMARASGHLFQAEKRAPWQLTTIGRAQAMRVLGESAVNKQFVQK